MSARPTPTQAVLRGHLRVSLPSVIVAVVVVLALRRYLGWGWFPAIVVGSLGGWPVWSAMVPRWRDWVIDSGLAPDDVQGLAAATGLVFPRGFPLERTELSRRDGTVGWGTSAERLQVVLPDGQTAADADDLRAFIGPNADYYLPQFAKAGPDARLQVLGWNWGAFLLNLAWLLYRRMFRVFWVALGVMFAVSFCLGVMQALGMASAMWMNRALMVGVSVFFGACGNSLYHRHVLRKLGTVSAYDASRREELARVGGVSWLWPIVVLVLTTAGLVLVLNQADQFPQV